mmetsp:Transcript_14884/g.28418  ORF Transcript_14884/g.28418 Transcript_14884/m.28418 type:complete len:206 (-) Transcript_14884:2116-2733(-)|eukprot:scaffold4510_cov183-Amphora_coffeaeformis.AAC.46
MKQELSVLLNVVPAMREVVGTTSYPDNNYGAVDDQNQLVEQPPTQQKQQQQPKQDLDKTAQQLHSAFRTFFRIVCQHFYPVIMLVDDLQWADEGSLNLMEVLITDPQNKRLVVIGVYRSNEVDETHILSKTRRDLEEKVGKGFSIRNIQLGNLGLPEVSQVVGSLLSVDDEARIAGLAQLCHKENTGECLFLALILVHVGTARIA